MYVTLCGKAGCRDFYGQKHGTKILWLIWSFIFLLPASLSVYVLGL